MTLFPAERLKARALEVGFNLVGVTRAEPSPTLDAYLRWIDAGYHAGMGYMARPDRVARRRDLHVIVPDARSMLIVGLDYHALNVPDDLLQDPSRGRFAAYAWGVDYHDIMTPRLESLAAWLNAESGIDAAGRVYVDTGAVLERSHGQQAGMGFIGKNTLLIHPRRGSYFFLGEIITDLEFDAYDAPAPESMCGRCTRCLQACPTNAFPRPYVLDAGRCISYLTIEHKGSIDAALRPLMGNWIYGCDVCQDVCPWQRFAVPTREPALMPRTLDTVAPPLLDMLALDDAMFKAVYGQTPVARIKRGRLVRNACVAAGNWGSVEAVPALKTLLNDNDALVREHAAWALWRIIGADARALLTARRDREPDESVRDALTLLLEGD